jgi:hypothetical protein
MKLEIFAGLLSLLFLASLVAAPRGGQGNGMNHLYLHSQDGEAWGKLTYSDYGYNFRGYSLEPDTNYTLIRLTHRGDVVCITMHYPEGATRKVTDKNGKLHTTGVWETRGGPQVWLVLSRDVNCREHRFVDSHPDKYLYGDNPI